MKRYYTLIQKYRHDNHGDKDLADFLLKNDIKYVISAAPGRILVEEGLADFNHTDDFYEHFYLIYVILVDEHELSVIHLSIGGLFRIRNRRLYQNLNKVRDFISKILFLK